VAVGYDCVASCTAASTTMDAANVRCVRPQLMWQPAHDKRHTGHTRTHSCTLQPLRRLCNPKPGEGARDEVRLNGRSGNLSHYGTSSATQSLARVHEAKCRRSLAAHVHRSHRHSRPRRTRAIATPPREQSTLSDPHCISCARGACNIRSDAMCRASDWHRKRMRRLASAADEPTGLRRHGDAGWRQPFARPHGRALTLWLLLGAFVRSSSPAS
jgi:hypothetical protein